MIRYWFFFCRFACERIAWCKRRKKKWRKKCERSNESITAVKRRRCRQKMLKKWYTHTSSKYDVVASIQMCGCTLCKHMRHKHECKCKWSWLSNQLLVLYLVVIYRSLSDNQSLRWTSHIFTMWPLFLSLSCYCTFATRLRVMHLILAHLFFKHLSVIKVSHCRPTSKKHAHTRSIYKYIYTPKSISSDYQFVYTSTRSNLLFDAFFIQNYEYIVVN